VRSLTFINSALAPLKPNGDPDCYAHPMIHFANLVAAWERFEETAFEAECRQEQALDEYCGATGPAPSRADVWTAKRLRFIANHRLRWMLYQTRRAQAHASLI
jgi:hypothetical protein